MEKNIGPGDPCVDCRGLKEGTRSTQDPHQYLVLSARSASPGAKSGTYRCLVCKTELSYEIKGRIAAWK